MKPILFNTETVKNVPLIRKRVLITIGVIWLLIVTYLFTYIGGYNNCKNKYEKEIAMHRDEVYFTIFETEEVFPNPYAFMPFLFNGEILDDEKATFIIKLSKALEIDPDFCISLLNKENPELNDLAISRKNKNGSVDIGLWQLNQNNFNDTPYSFDKIYWQFDVPFDPYNWKHNTWIALHHIQELYKEFGDYKKVAQAYNGGASRVRKNSVVSMAKNYSEIVMKTYNNLKA